MGELFLIAQLITSHQSVPIADNAVRFHGESTFSDDVLATAENTELWRDGGTVRFWFSPEHCVWMPPNRAECARKPPLR